MGNIMKAITVVTVITIMMMTNLMAAAAYPAAVSTRIKDIAKVQGVRPNQLVGYGLVVGLAGTGDSATKNIETMQSIANMLKSFGVIVTAKQLQTKNVAAVVVTAQLPPFVKPGDTIDISVSSMGDAKSLQGGTLLQTPLKAGNGMIYAVAQGAVTTGGFIVGSAGNTQQKNFPTAGITSNGAIVEREVPVQLLSANGSLMLALARPDFTTASRIGDAINGRFGSIATARDPGTVVVEVPGDYRGDVVSFVSAIEELPVTPDNIAKVVVNERTGTVVIGSNVTIDEVAVAQGGLSVRISRSNDVSQPPPFSYGTTARTSNTDVTVNEEPAHMITLPATANVGDVVDALNAIGATPRDIISILQAMKAAGALHADLEII